MPTDPILIQTEWEEFLVDSGLGNGKLTEKQLTKFWCDAGIGLKESLQDSRSYSR